MSAVGKDERAAQVDFPIDLEVDTGQTVAILDHFLMMSHDGASKQTNQIWQRSQTIASHHLIRALTVGIHFQPLPAASISLHPPPSDSIRLHPPLLRRNDVCIRTTYPHRLHSSAASELFCFV